MWYLSKQGSRGNFCNVEDSILYYGNRYLVAYGDVEINEGFGMKTFDALYEDYVYEMVKG